MLVDNLTTPHPDWTSGNAVSTSTTVATNSTTLDPVGDTIAGILMGSFSSIGLVVNGGVAYVLTKVGGSNQYNNLCISLAIADCGVMTLFTIWSTPLTFTQDEQFATGFLGKKVGQLILVFVFGTLYSTLIIAINRFLAISRPVKYAAIFSTSKTVKYILLAWCLCFLHQTIYFIPTCDFIYYPSIYHWGFQKSRCGWWLAWGIDFGYTTSIMLVIVYYNMRTFAAIRKARSQKIGVMNDPQEEMKRKKEIKFFVMSVINGAVFIFMFFSFHVLAHFAKDKWSLFLSTSFIWQISHATNGFVILALNEKVRGYIWHQVRVVAITEATPIATNPTNPSHPAPSVPQ